MAYDKATEEMVVAVAEFTHDYLTAHPEHAKVSTQLEVYAFLAGGLIGGIAADEEDPKMAAMVLLQHFTDMTTDFINAGFTVMKSGEF